METTYVMIKPDGVQRSLIGEIIGRLEAKGLRLDALDFRTPDEKMAEQHYGVHSERPFFRKLVDFITSGPVVAMAWTGKNAISIVRTLVGGTNPAEAEPGTIRGDLAIDVGRNVIHASDGPETAEYELRLWFPDGVMTWTPTRADHIYE